MSPVGDVPLALADGAALARHGASARWRSAARGGWLGRVPVGLFAIAAGLFGLGNSWRAASAVWGVTAIVGESVLGVAMAVWLALSVLYLAKWILARDAARAEWDHPVQCCFVALFPVTTMLAALAMHPYSHAAARTVFWLGAVSQITFMIYRVGGFWYGGRDPLTTTPVLYLPAVAGSFVCAIAGSALGYGILATLVFGAGLFSWIALESVILQRLLVYERIAPRLLPSLGIQLAPPAVGCLAYLGLSTGAADHFALMLLGYGLLQAAVLLRLASLFRAQPFIPSYWAFTFGATALASAAIRIAIRTPLGDNRDILNMLALVLFVAANALVSVIFVRTILLTIRGRLIPSS